MLNNASGTPMAVGDSLIAAVLGYAIVFVGLIVLMWVVMIVGRFMFGRSKKNKEKPVEAAQAAPVAAPVAAPAPAPTQVSALAPGSAGDIKLYDTPPKVAAMIMAIVADEMGKPLNELRFKSIKEVK